MNKLFLFFFLTCFTFLTAQVEVVNGTDVISNENNGNEKNIVKFDYMRATLNGDFCVAYERAIGPFFSIEGGVGLTYYNFADALYLTMLDENYWDIMGLSNRFNYSINAGIRFYLMEKYMEGLYINPKYRIVNYKYINKEVSYSASQLTRFNDYGLAIGYNHFLGQAFFDYYIGGGLRQIQSNIESNQTGTTINTISNRNVPLILLGCRVGIAF